MSEHLALGWRHNYMLCTNPKIWSLGKETTLLNSLIGKIYSFVI